MGPSRIKADSLARRIAIVLTRIKSDVAVRPIKGGLHTGESAMGVKIWGLILIFALAVALTGAGRPPTRIDPIARESLALGEAIAKRDCGGCHAVGRLDNSRLPRAPRLRDLHRRYPVEHLGEALAEGIVVGHGPMPQWVFEPHEIEALIAYLKSLEPDAPARRTRP
jgi:mono/diheme cytochrome c family protein